MEKRLSELMANFAETEQRLADETPDNAVPQSIPLQRTKSPMDDHSDADPNHKLDEAAEENDEPTNLRRNDLSSEIKMMEAAIKKLSVYVLLSDDPDAFMIYRTIKRLLTEMKFKENAAAVDMEQDRYNHDSQERYGMKRTASFETGDNVDVDYNGLTTSGIVKEVVRGDGGYVVDAAVVQMQNGGTRTFPFWALKKMASKRTAMFVPGTKIKWEHNGEIWEGTVVENKGTLILVDHPETDAAGLMEVDPYTVVDFDEPSDLSCEVQLDKTRGQQPVAMRANSQHTPIDSEPKSSIGSKRTGSWDEMDDAYKAVDDCISKGIKDPKEIRKTVREANPDLEMGLVWDVLREYGLIERDGSLRTAEFKKGDKFIFEGFGEYGDGKAKITEVLDDGRLDMKVTSNEKDFDGGRWTEEFTIPTYKLERGISKGTVKEASIHTANVIDMQGNDIDVHDVVEWEGKRVEIVDVMESGNIMIEYDDKLIGVHPQETVKVGFYKKSERLINFAAARRIAYEIGDGADIKEKVDQFRSTEKGAAVKTAEQVDQYFEDKYFTLNDRMFYCYKNDGTTIFYYAVDADDNQDGPDKQMPVAKLQKKFDEGIGRIASIHTADDGGWETGPRGGQRKKGPNGEWIYKHDGGSGKSKSTSTDEPKDKGDKSEKSEQAPAKQKSESPTNFKGPKDDADSVSGDAQTDQQVVALLDNLADMANQAKEKGEKAENYDLCKVSVPGTNLFCDANVGIPRAEMPQLKGKPEPGSQAEKEMKGDEADGEAAFKQSLKDKGVKITKTSVPATQLKASQTELVGPKVAGMMKALEKDPNHPKITAPIFVSKDGYVLDGHHRWAAMVAYQMAKGDGKPVEMPVEQVDMDIKDLIKYTNDFANEYGIAQKSAKTGALRSIAMLEAEIKALAASNFKVGDAVQHEDGREGKIVDLPTVGTIEPFEASVQWDGDPDTEFNVDLDKLTKVIIRGAASSADMDVNKLDQISKQVFGKPYDELDESETEQLEEYLISLGSKRTAALEPDQKYKDTTDGSILVIMGIGEDGKLSYYYEGDEQVHRMSPEVVENDIKNGRLVLASKRKADWQPDLPKSPEPESHKEDYVVGDRVMFYDADAGDMPQVGEITVVHPDGNMNIKNENGEQLTIGFHQVMRRVSMKRQANFEVGDKVRLIDDPDEEVAKVIKVVSDNAIWIEWESGSQDARNPDEFVKVATSKRTAMKRVANDKLMKHVDFDDIALGIEWPKDSLRQYSDGFQQHMKCDYGYVRNSLGDDGEDLDVYVGDPKSLNVHRVQQLKAETGEHDEYKYMLGFPDVKSAVSMYLQHQPLEHFGGCEAMDMDQFRHICKTGDEQLQNYQAPVTAGEEDISHMEGEGA